VYKHFPDHVAKFTLGFRPETRLDEDEEVEEKEEKKKKKEKKKKEKVEK
jgi:hypothetical protein